MAERRTYGQFCAVAKALDVLGERWTLLIVRDLLMGPKRYTDLREGLPGIGTDLLTDRLRTLEAAGLVARRRLPPPAPATIYELTERSAELAPVLRGLARVGFGFLDAPEDDVEVPADRFVLALRALFEPGPATEADRTYQLDLGGQTFTLAVRGSVLEVTPGVAPRPDLALRSDPVTLTRLLRDDTGAAQALASGALEIDGDPSELDRFVATFAWDGWERRAR